MSMLPKLELKLSSSYNLILNDEFNYPKFLKDYNSEVDKFNKKFEKFKIETKAFQKAFKKYQKVIIKLIQKYSGFSWKGQYIPVYLVKMTKKPSISDPLTLKFKENIDSMLILLIHELTHVNIPYKLQLDAGQKVQEQWVNLITRYTAIELGLDLSRASMLNFNEALELNWNLKNKPLKLFLKK